MNRLKARTVYPPSAALIPLRALLEGGLALIGYGNAVRKRTKELREYFGVKHVFLVSSGKAALVLILQALHSLKPDRPDVLLPAYTCYSVPSAVLKAGLEPKLVDVCQDSFGFDELGLERAASSATLCVVASHLLGVSENMNAVGHVARKSGAFVVEDAAQSMGVRREGAFLGCIGDVGFFSFGRGKNLTCGAGGVILTDDDTIAERVAIRFSGLRDLTWRENAIEFAKAVLLSVFVRPSLYWIPSSFPQLRLGETHFEPDFRVARLSKVQGGLLCGWQTRLESSNLSRKRNGDAIAAQIKERQLPGEAVPLRYPWLLRSRAEKERVLEMSKEQGLGISGMYPTALNKVPELEDRFEGQDFPNAGRLSQHLVTAPTHELVPPAYFARFRTLLDAIKWPLD